MKVTRSYLQNLLLDNVAEIKFIRRVPKPGAASIRHMLCTNSESLLSSPNGRVILNYKPAIKPLHFDPTIKNLVVTWDIMMQDYRLVSMDDCDLIQKWPANDTFWKYFNEKIYPMSPGDKLLYMDT